MLLCLFSHSANPSPLSELVLTELCNSVELDRESSCEADILSSISTLEAMANPSSIGGMMRLFVFVRIIPFLGSIDKVIKGRQELVRHFEMWC